MEEFWFAFWMDYTDESGGYAGIAFNGTAFNRAGFAQAGAHRIAKYQRPAQWGGLDTVSYHIRLPHQVDLLDPTRD